MDIVNKLPPDVGVTQDLLETDVREKYGPHHLGGLDRLVFSTIVLTPE